MKESKKGGVSEYAKIETGREEIKREREPERERIRN